MTYDNPEGSAMRFGEEIARIRNRMGWSRPKLVHRLSYSIPDDKMMDRISEAWLQRLESGRMVKVTRSIVEGLCVALNVSPQERARLLLLADRNILYNENEFPDRLTEILNYISMEIHREASIVLDDLGASAEKFTDEDIEALVLTAFEVVLKGRVGERHRPYKR